MVYLPRMPIEFFVFIIDNIVLIKIFMNNKDIKSFNYEELRFYLILFSLSVRFGWEHP